MSDRDRTVLKAPSLADVTRELREHKLNHGGLNCPICDLWNIYTLGSRSDLDEFIARLETGDGPTRIDADILASARAIRHAWGEGDWTNP